MFTCENYIRKPNNKQKKMFTCENYIRKPNNNNNCLQAYLILVKICQAEMPWIDIGCSCCNAEK